MWRASPFRPPGRPPQVLRGARGPGGCESDDGEEAGAQSTSQVERGEVEQPSLTRAPNPHTAIEALRCTQNRNTSATNTHAAISILLLLHFLSLCVPSFPSTTQNKQNKPNRNRNRVQTSQKKMPSFIRFHRMPGWATYEVLAVDTLPTTLTGLLALFNPDATIFATTESIFLPQRNVTALNSDASVLWWTTTHPLQLLLVS